jgi:hypothetical protein
MTTSSHPASATTGPDVLAERLAVALVDRGAAFSGAAVPHAAAVLTKQTGVPADVALLSVRAAIAQRAIPGAKELAPEVAAVLHEVVGDLVAARATEDEERPAFALADWIDRTGVELEMVRPIFEAALLAARNEAQHEQAGSATPTPISEVTHTESVTPDAAPHDTPRNTITPSRTRPSRSRAARAGSGSPASLVSAAEPEQRSFPTPTGPCPVCRRGTRWFLRDIPGSGGWICAVCHPPAISPTHFSWHDNELGNAPKAVSAAHPQGAGDTAETGASSRLQSAIANEPSGDTTRCLT